MGKFVFTIVKFIQQTASFVYLVWPAVSIEDKFTAHEVNILCKVYCTI